MGAESFYAENTEKLSAESEVGHIRSKVANMLEEYDDTSVVRRYVSSLAEQELGNKDKIIVYDLLDKEDEAEFRKSIKKCFNKYGRDFRFTLEDIVYEESDKKREVNRNDMRASEILMELCDPDYQGTDEEYQRLEAEYERLKSDNPLSDDFFGNDDNDDYWGDKSSTTDEFEEPKENQQVNSDNQQNQTVHDQSSRGSLKDVLSNASTAVNENPQSSHNDARKTDQQVSSESKSQSEQEKKLMRDREFLQLLSIGSGRRI